MKNYYLMLKTIFSFLLITSLVGCQDDFLETTPLSEVSDSSVWVSPVLAEAAVLDLYQGTWAGVFTSETTTDAFTDHGIFTHSGRNVDHYTGGQMVAGGSHMKLPHIDWTEIYPYIRGANIAIQKLSSEDNQLSESLTTRLLGESYFMRAYYYSQLMRQYGGVVLSLEPFTLSSESSNPRSSFSATVDQIVSDLDTAITLLDDVAITNKARANKLTAHALKSRVLTHAASDLHDSSKNGSVSTIAAYANKELIGYTSGTQASRWQAAKSASQAFLDAAAGYKLDYSAPADHAEAIQNYTDMWLQGPANVDFLWGRLLQEPGYETRTYPGGSDGWHFGPAMLALYQGPNGYHEWSGTTPTEALVSKYTMSDGTPFDWNNLGADQDPYADREARFYSTILYDGAGYKERAADAAVYDKFNQLQTGIYQFSDGTTKNGLDTRKGPIEDWNGTRSNYYFNKFIDPSLPAGYPVNTQKVAAPYLRHTEVLLNYIEATINLGEEADAKAWLNKLRFRNGLPAVTASGADLVELYKLERDKELVNEDARFFDMKRWLDGPASLNKQAKAVSIIGTQKSGSTMTPSTYKKSISDFDYTYSHVDITLETREWKDKVYFMPIPLDEINKDTSLIQNPGY